jgi:hypothetical protein
MMRVFRTKIHPPLSLAPNTLNIHIRIQKSNQPHEKQLFRRSAGKHRFLLCVRGVMWFFGSASTGCIPAGVGEQKRAAEQWLMDIS